ncbi:Retrovirus-related Pol polyprotein [Thelohanellus kitauei]|uniref:Retrovirus-related Pol polyprotein n=1 Tax=Thelohanellus kitauei TaxID=669202 RepID=A0A0C2IQH4_THEKT|nr:Retrovirus-related Pol polyprotein [Thelohanellus kitauei]
MASKFVWRGLKKQISEWSRSCNRCQIVKTNRNAKTPFKQHEILTGRFMHINLDFVGPLPTSKGYSHLLTIVDRYTKWAEDIPISDTSANECARVLVFHWIDRFGVMMHITTDWGPQFSSDLWNQLHKILEYHAHLTTANHPQANGFVERYHHHLKAALCEIGRP